MLRVGDVIVLSPLDTSPSPSVSPPGDPIADALIKFMAFLLPGVGLLLGLIVLVLKVAEQAIG